jgi:hypothetical protein
MGFDPDHQASLFSWHPQSNFATTPQYIGRCRLGRQQNLATRFVNLSAQLIQPKIYETGHLFTNQKQNITSQNYHK